MSILNLMYTQANKKFSNTLNKESIFKVLSQSRMNIEEYVLTGELKDLGTNLDAVSLRDFFTR